MYHAAHRLRCALTDAVRSLCRALTDTATPLRRPLRTAVDAAATALACVAFWSAVALPFVHVPLFVAVGLTPKTAPAFAGLWLLNGVALVAGARHSPSGRRFEN